MMFEVNFFGAIDKSGARALLIGRRALIALGMPVLTADYDLWLSAKGTRSRETPGSPRRQDAKKRFV